MLLFHMNGLHFNIFDRLSVAYVTLTLLCIFQPASDYLFGIFKLFLQAKIMLIKR